MKRCLAYFIVFIFIINLVGCKNSKEENEEQTKFDMVKAGNTVDAYMKALIEGDDETIANLLTEKLNQTKENTNKSSLSIKGYKKNEQYQIGEMATFKVMVASTSLDSSRATLDSYTINVTFQDWNYKISDINIDSKKESYFQGEGLRIRSEDKVKSELLIDKDGIPQYGFSSEDKAKILKIPIPRGNFGNLIFAYSGDSIAISTTGDLCYMGIVSIGTDSMSSGSKDNSDNQSGDNKTSSAREVPIGKELKSLDIMKNSKIDFMVFSPDENFLLIQYTYMSKLKAIQIYNSESGELIPFDFRENFNTSSLNIEYDYFKEDNLYFNIVPIEDKKQVEANVTGQWKLDLKEFKVEKAS